MPRSEAGRRACADAAAAEEALRAALRRPGLPSSDHDLSADPVPPGPVPLPARPLRPAAVLLAVDLSAPEPRVILTKRAAHLRHHPGQIALPGGRIEPGETPAAAALREAAEEVGLPPDRPAILGTLPVHETVTGFAVTPVLAVIRTPFVPRPQAGEVEEVFGLPLSHCADPVRYRVEGRVWGGRRRLYWVAPWGPYYLWGATACILRGLALRLAPEARPEAP
ncbi:CoA pyrophosphatase [Rubellimicrobium sp. CFH 75288]|uniref:NUDIX hydrolase n=1 Tax=Rubellimicrobium sp. CFH 75288 TaxID=2697034 RepID=UPI003529D623